MYATLLLLLNQHLLRQATNRRGLHVTMCNRTRANEIRLECYDMFLVSSTSVARLTASKHSKICVEMDP